MEVISDFYIFMIVSLHWRSILIVDIDLDLVTGNMSLAWSAPAISYESKNSVNS